VAPHPDSDIAMKEGSGRHATDTTGLLKWDPWSTKEQAFGPPQDASDRECSL